MNKIDKIIDTDELLIVIDMVNGFVKEGSLAASNIQKIIPRQKEIIKNFLDKKKGLIFVRDAHSKNSIEFKRYPEHCLKDDVESTLIDELKEFEDDGITYLKNSTNLIYSMENDLLKFKNLHKVSLIGCLSEICVFDGAISLRTFFDEHDMDVDVYVYEDGIDTYDSSDHPNDEITKEALKWMKMKGIKVIERSK